MPTSIWSRIRRSGDDQRGKAHPHTGGFISSGAYIAGSELAQSVGRHLENLRSPRRGLTGTVCGCAGRAGVRGEQGSPVTQLVNVPDIDLYGIDVSFSALQDKA